MTRAPAPHPARLRARGLALACSALIGLATFCWQLTAITRSAWRSVLAAGPADPSEALIALAGSLAVFLILWLAGALTLSLLAALSKHGSAFGRATARSAGLVAPLVLRNAVAALLGVTIAAVPAMAAEASGPSTAPGQSTSVGRSTQVISIDDELSPSWAPPQHPMRKPSATTPAATPKTIDQETVPRTPISARATPRVPDPASATPYASASPNTTRGGHPINADPNAYRRDDPIEADLLPGWLPGKPPAPIRSSTGDSDLSAPPSRRRAPIASDDDDIVVRRGDSLWDIAARHLGTHATDGEIALEWPYWFTANREAIGGDPDHLVPGERLRPPSPAERRRAPTQGGARRRLLPAPVSNDGSAQ